MKFDENKIIRSERQSSLSLKEAALKCNRCGACAQMCPSYKANPSEVHSPRALNQLARKLTENKIKLEKNKARVLEVASSCINCKSCLLACPAGTSAPVLAKEMCSLFNYSPLGIFRRSRILFAVNFPSVYFALKSLFVKLPREKQPPKYFFAPSAASLRGLPKTLALLKQYAPLRVLKSSLFLGAADLTLDEQYLLKIYEELLKEYSKAPKALPIITDGLDTYFALKSASFYGKKYDVIAGNVIYITDLRMAPLPKKHLWENKKIIMQIPASAKNLITEDKVKILFNCKDAKFMLEFNSQTPLAAGYLAYGGKNSAAKQIALVFAQGVRETRADILIVFNAEEEKYFNKIFAENASQTSALFITRALEILYDRTGN